VYLENPQRVFDGVYRCMKFGRNWLCSLEDMPVSMLCEFGSEIPIHSPFGKVFLGVKWKLFAVLSV